jgi:hypothetical protein
MINISVTNTGGREVLQRFALAGPSVRARLHTTMEFIGSELVTLMKSRASSLERRTGKLDRAFYTRTDVKDGGNRFLTTTGITKRAFYGRFQDTGIGPKVVDVKGYARSVASRNVKEGRRRVASGIGFVSAYKRQMHLARVPFIGSSLEVMRSTIVAEIRLAVAGATRGV